MKVQDNIIRRGPDGSIEKRTIHRVPHWAESSAAPVAGVRAARAAPHHRSERGGLPCRACAQALHLVPAPVPAAVPWAVVPPEPPAELRALRGLRRAGR